MPSPRLLLLLALTTACGPGKPDQTTDDPSTSSATAPPATDSAADPTTGGGSDEPPNPATSETNAATSEPPDPSGTSEPPNPSSASEPGTGGTGGTDDTTTGELIPCDVGLQDCPEGMKCSVFTDGPDSIFQGMFKCVPLDPDPQPPHAACDVFGDPNDGTDDCALGAICLDLADDGTGECFSFCDFSGGPVCAVANDVCVGATCQTCTWSFCDANCDPLDPSTCDEGQVCAPNSEAWTCLPDASGEAGGHGSPCEFANACDPGHVCVDQMNLPMCAGQGCCAAACDTTAPECPQGLECEPWYEEGTAPSPELATLGVCIL